MSMTSTIPITVAPDATARVAELGMEPQLEQMLEHTRQAVPGLRAIAVTLAPPYDLGDEPRVIIEATMDDRHSADDPTDRQWGEWMVNAFPPDVGRHFCMLSVYGADDEG